MAPAFDGLRPEIYSLKLKKKLTALVADGDNTCRKVLRGNLRVAGVETEGVDNGRAALDLITSGATFDLICIEKRLPVVDGPEVVREIRAMGIPVKILGLDAFLLDDDVREFLDAGVDECMGKPYDLDRLAAILKELDDK